MDEQQKKKKITVKISLMKWLIKPNGNKNFMIRPLHELQTEERYVNYFKGFRPESIETVYALLCFQ